MAELCPDPERDAGGSDAQAGVSSCETGGRTMEPHTFAHE